MTEDLEIQPTEVVQGTFVERLMWTFLSPKRLYADIAAGVDWWQPLVWVSVVNMVTSYISLPIQVKLAGLNPDGVSAEELEQTLLAMQDLKNVGLLLISTPVAVLFFGVIVAGVSYLILSVLSERSTFKHYFSLYLYSSVVMSVGVLLGTVLTRMKGLDAIRTMEDAFVSFGPAMMFSPDSKIVTSVLTTFDIFYIWFYVLLGAGVVHVFKVPPRSAAVVVVPVWLVFVLVSLVSARVTG
jgi:hypothetical protein